MPQPLPHDGTTATLDDARADLDRLVSALPIMPKLAADPEPDEFAEERERLCKLIATVDALLVSLKGSR